MKIRRAGQGNRVGFAALAFALALLACGAAIASDVERQVPVTRDSAGSGVTVEISREGTRQTATPFVTLNDPTVQRIGRRIEKDVARWTAKGNPPAATVADPSRIGLTGASREESGRPDATIASLPPLPGEITIRTLKGFLKGLRASRKEKPAPAVTVPTRELRLGMAATAAPRHSN